MELTPVQIKQINKLLWEEKAIVYHPVKAKGFCNINKNKRFGTWVFKGSGSKNLLKQFLSFNNEYKCIAQINDINGYRQFIPFKTWQDCWDAYIHAGYRKRYLYELILSNNPCKPYLDIEWKLKDGENLHNYDCSNFLTSLKEDLVFIFLNRYNIKISDEHILICECHRDNKISFHVILNIIIDNKYFAFNTNRKRESNSAWDLFVALVNRNPDYKNKIDESVYSLDREFRAIYSTKFNDYVSFTPINNHKHGKFCDNYLDYFITHFNTGYPILFINAPYVNPNLQLIKKYSKITDVKGGNHIKEYKSDYSNSENKEIVNKILELLQFIHPTSCFTGMTANNKGYRFSYSDKNEVCFTGHTHKSNGFSVFIKPSNGNIYMFCYSNKCQRLYKLGNLHYDTLWRIEAMRINHKFLDYKTEINFNLWENEDLKLSALINKFVEFGGNYVIKSNMGTGKTQLLKKIISLKFKDKRILYLSHRQTFTHNIAGTFAELGFYNYLDGVFDLNEKNKVIVQIDSLMHLLSAHGELTYFDFVVLDEIESLLCHLSSPTLSNKRTIICLILEQVIKNAKWVLSMDADFSNRGYEFLNKIKDKPKIIINDYISVKKKFLFTSNYELRCHQLVEDVKNKKNIAVICLSKNTLDDIYEKLKNVAKNIIRYTSMTDDSQKTLLTNVNSEWKKYQVVMYSPTIEAGVDFNVEHFNKIYCFLSNGSCCPRSFLQMIGRIRTTTDDRIRCCYERTMKYVDKKAYIPNINDVEDMIANKEHLYNKYTFDIINDKKCQLLVKKDAFTIVFAYNYLENYEKQIHFLSILKELIVQHEWEYINEDAGETEETNVKTEQKEESSKDSSHENTEFDIGFDNEIQNNSTASSKKTVEMDDLLEAPLIDNETAKIYEDKKNSNMLTRVEKLSLKKYWILKKFKLKPEDLNLEFLLNWYGKEYILDNVAYALGKKKLNDVNDPYLNNMREKLNYLDIILKVFGFKNIFDFDLIVEKDEAMENRMKQSNLLNGKEYETIMKCFGKRIQGTKDNKFSLNKYIMICEMIFNEFGVGLINKRGKKIINQKAIYYRKYCLKECRRGISIFFST